MEPKNEKEAKDDPMMDEIMIDIDENLLFPEDTFSIPDFPCLSLSSSSSPPPLDHPPKNPTSPSSSSSSSWNLNLNFLSNPNTDVDFLENFLPDDIELLDPNLLFPDEENAASASANTENGNGEVDKVEEGGADLSEELGKVFLEWLKNNRDAILPEDLRTIKLKKSTIECAAARLGEGRQGRMQLVKLILAWVQNHHLQRRRRRHHQQQQQQDQQQQRNESSPPDPLPVLESAPANPNPNPECNFDSPPWPHYAFDPMMGQQPGGYYPPFPPMQPPYPPVVPMQYAPYPMPAPPAFLYQPPTVSGMNSATKEARKKRMARQRRYSALHQSRSNHQSQHHPYQSHATVDQGGASSAETTLISRARSWALMSSPPPTNPSPRRAKSAAEAVPNVPQKRSVSCLSEKRQTWKSEKNLRFLLQKVLKQSDVGSLGRIVLPKKEAESHLPELDARDGISIPMEDIGTSRVWNMRYRYWPNNKSRMYLLENTGEFVRSNGLQEGDFIVLYSDIKRNKYMIRGVKVRPSLSEQKVSTVNRNTGKSHQKINDLEESSSNSLNKAASSSESNDGMMEFFADGGEDEDIASTSVIKIDA